MYSIESKAMDKKVRDLGYYLLNICLLSSDLSQTPPNELVASALLIISKLVTNSVNFADVDLEKEFNCISDKFKTKAKQIVEWVSVYEGQADTNFSAVRRKFESEVYSCVGKLKLVTGQMS